MKKFIAIFFITVIGMFFASTTVYAYSFFGKVSVITKASAGSATSGLMNYELEDGFEEVIHNLDAGLPVEFKFTSGTLATRSKFNLYRFVSGAPSITRPIYLSYHKLLI